MHRTGKRTVTCRGGIHAALVLDVRTIHIEGTGISEATGGRDTCGERISRPYTTTGSRRGGIHAALVLDVRTIHIEGN